MEVKSNFTSTAYCIGISSIFLIMSTRYFSESDFVIMLCITIIGTIVTLLSDMTTKISIVGDELHIRKWLFENHKIKINDITQIIDAESNYWNYSHVHFDYICSNKIKRLSVNSGNYRILKLRKLLTELKKI